MIWNRQRSLSVKNFKVKNKLCLKVKNEMNNDDDKLSAIFQWLKIMTNVSYMNSVQVSSYYKMWTPF